MGMGIFTMRASSAVGVRGFLSTAAIVLGCGVSGIAAAAAPTISGSPPTSIRINTYYKFIPTASDPDTATNKLRFTIANKPAWAGFSVYTGTLYGTPTAAGTWSNIRITVSDGTSSASLPLFAISASSTGGTTNRPPTISGTPLTSVAVGNAYSFRPTASDPEGRTLTFSITNRPSWASFNTSNGTLSGTPTASNVGTYSNIVIRASDGTLSAALPAFAVTVVAVGNGSATLSWTPPTRNTDGTSLTNLAGYRIYYGTSSGSLTRTVQIANPGVASYVVGSLTPATWYFSVRSYTTTGAVSAASNIASKTVR
jgi:Putative Ig domain